MLYINGLLIVIALLLTIWHGAGRPVPLWVSLLLVEIALLVGRLG
jgi:hypothetical protein